MISKAELIHIIPVLPSADINRVSAWYEEKAVFETYYKDNIYAALFRENIYLHLQWHADTEHDPLPGGSVIRILVKNIKPLFEEFAARGQLAMIHLGKTQPGKQMSLDFMT